MAAVFIVPVFVNGGEFGRQLVANGDNGTGHGKGNVIMLIGRGVRGGIYGDMFPKNELERLGGYVPDITGLTTIDSLFSVVSDWVEPGSGAAIFPDLAFSTVEDGVDFGSLFI